MNKWKIGVVIAGAVMLALGIGLFLFGLSLGATPVVALGTNSKGVTDNRNMVSGSIDIKEFDRLSVDVSSINVDFKTGDDYRIEYSVYEDNIPVVEQNGNKLTVNQPDHTYIFSMDFRTQYEKQVYTIIVPENDTVYDIYMEASSGGLSVSDLNIAGEMVITSGDINLENITSDKLKLSETSGEIVINGSRIAKTEAKITSGDYNVNDSELNDVNITLTSGGIDFSDIKCDNAFFHMTSGDLKATFIGSENDYSYDFDMTSGDVTIAGAKFDGDFKKDNNTDKKIKIEMTSGSADIDFK